MIRLASFSVAEILPLIGLGKPKIQLGGFSVNASSNRLECFRRSQTCAHCNRKGTLFVLEHHDVGAPKGIQCFIDNCQWCSYRQTEYNASRHAAPHLNLYAVDRRNDLMLMTQDHIMPRMHGGENVMENLQTMCRVCNQRKGATIPKGLRV